MEAHDQQFGYCDVVKDRVTGYVGKVTGFCNYFGVRENSYLVEGIDSTGRPIEWWVPVGRAVRQ